MGKTVEDLGEGALRSVVSRLTGPRGVKAIRVAAEKKLKLLRHTLQQVESTLKDLEAKKNRVLGEISSQEDVMATFDLLLEESGLDDLVLQGAAPESPQVEPKISLVSLDAEVQAHLDKGLCIYRDRKGKFCQRRLRSKEEQKNQHCLGHWEKLEAGIDPGLIAAPKKKAAKRVAGAK